MAKKVNCTEFRRRFFEAHDKNFVEIIQYTAITKPVIVQCKKCGKQYTYKNGNYAITNFNCCEQKNKLDKVIEWLAQRTDFDYISKIDSDNILIRHNICGNTFKKNYHKFFSSPDACNYCKTKNVKLGNSLRDAQDVLDKIFFGDIQLLQYNGRHSKCNYRCVKCGQIFSQKFDRLLGSSGCPKCDKRQSQGEKQIKQLLEQQAPAIVFKEQVGVEELPRQHFDFAIYEDYTYQNILYFIEVQGEQHFQPVKYWGGQEKYQQIITRDNKKRNYCKEHNIPLYELVYKNKKFTNLEILPFNSTTISAKESTI